MTDLERLAREAGMVQDGEWFFSTEDGADCDVSLEALARFAALVRADALEEAAKACTALAESHKPSDDYDMPPGPYQCAAAIRAL